MAKTATSASRAAHELPTIAPLAAAARAYFSPPQRRHRARVAGLSPEERTLAIQRVETLEVETARVILCVLSSLLGESQDNERQQAAKSINLLKRAGALEWINEYTHETEPAPHPELCRLGCPTGSAALNALGLKGPDIGKCWSDRHTAVEDSCLPLCWVLEFVPAPFWPLLATVIEMGPDEVRSRTKKVFGELASTPLPVNKRRPEERGLAVSSMLQDAAKLWNFMDAAVGLQKELKVKEKKRQSELERRRAVSPEADLPSLALPTLLLEEWIAKPKRLTASELRSLGARQAQTDTSAPPAEHIKKRLKELATDAEVHRSAEEIRRRRKVYALQKLVEFALMILYGLRPAAAAALNVEHYKPDYPFEHGRGPTLIVHVESLTENGAVLDPNKTRSGSMALALPPEVATWIEKLIHLSGRTLEEQGEHPLLLNGRGVRKSTGNIYNDFAGCSAGTRNPLMRAGVPLLAVDAFRVGMRRAKQRCAADETTFNGGRWLPIKSTGETLELFVTVTGENTYEISTRSAGDPGSAVSRAYGAQDAVLCPNGSAIEHQWIGYSPTRYRHHVTQLADRATERWKIERPAQTGHIKVEDPGELLIGHKLPGYGYRDKQQLAKREGIIASIVPYMWEELWEDGAVRVGIDPSAVLRARTRRDDIEARIQFHEAEAERLEHKRIEALRRSTRLTDLTALQRLTNEALAMSGEASRHLREVARLHMERATAQAAFDQACNESVRLTDPSWMDDAAYASACAEAVGAIDEPVHDAIRLADELTTAQAAQLWGRTPKQVREWRNGKSFPHWKPWLAHEGETPESAWRCVNKKDWRLPVERINVHALSDEQRELLDRLRRQP